MECVAEGKKERAEPRDEEGKLARREQVEDEK
jgi:hypothetical protein